MLPLTLLKTAQGHPMIFVMAAMVPIIRYIIHECYIHGNMFWRMHECYIHGNTIKYLRVPDEVIDKVQEEAKSHTDRKPPGVGRGRGRGREDGPGRQLKGIGRGSYDRGRGMGGRGRAGRGGGRGRG